MNRFNAGQELNIGGIHLLRRVNADRPLKLTFAEGLPESGSGPVTRICKHQTEIQLWPKTIKFLQGNGPLALRLLVFLRNTSSFHPLQITRPVSGEKEAQTDWNRKIVLGKREIKKDPLPKGMS
ncbi:hypothetical protein M1R55_30570 (plasmid) [Deinococcus sp. QL22]|nr:hypothetical protein M1R55_30570 [Deinococcus sp. QL22]